MEIKKLPESEVILNLQIKIVELIGKNKDSEKDFVRQMNVYFKIIRKLFIWDENYRISEMQILEDEEEGFNFMLDKAETSDGEIYWDENYNEIWLPEISTRFPKEYIAFFNADGNLPTFKKYLKTSEKLLNSSIKEIASLEKAYENSPSTTLKKMLDKKKSDLEGSAQNIENYQNRIDETQEKIDVWNKILEDEKKNGIFTL